MLITIERASNPVQTSRGTSLDVLQPVGLHPACSIFLSGLQAAALQQYLGACQVPHMQREIQPYEKICPDYSSWTVQKRESFLADLDAKMAQAGRSASPDCL
jgi:hypothetical protein